MKAVIISLAAVVMISSGAVIGGKIGLDALKNQAQASHVQKTAKHNAQMQMLLAQL